MQHWRNRETRKSVRISVRVRTDDGWIDATVRNLSSRGMMLHSPHQLRRNQFVEVARGQHRVVGRIVWNDSGVCGLHSREALDVAGLLAAPEGVSAEQRDERRRQPRDAAPAYVPTTAERAESARFFGRAMEHGFMLLAVSCAAIVAMMAVAEMFQTPLAQVDAVLAR